MTQGNPKAFSHTAHRVSIQALNHDKIVSLMSNAALKSAVGL